MKLQLDKIKRACRMTELGKLTPRALYVHNTVLLDLPLPLRDMVVLAHLIHREKNAPEEARLPIFRHSLIKMYRDGSGLSFLGYKDFDHDPHPSLQYSLHTNFLKKKVRILDYRKSKNPPILHRKELFVKPSYVYYDKFRLLSRREAEFGLLGRNDIGTVDTWAEVLEEEGYEIVGHSIRRKE